MVYKRKDLEKLIQEKLNIGSISPMINKQISKFVTELGLSYKQIAQVLVFYSEVENETLDPKYGIGIVPHVKDRALAYFEIKRKEKEQKIKSVEEANKHNDIILEPKKLQKKKQIPKINIEDLEV